jgi:hypothetical protein
MAVLGPSVAGLLAYFVGNQAAGDATFLPRLSKKMNLQIGFFRIPAFFGLSYWVRSNSVR